jgi:hypothetical protein
MWGVVLGLLLFALSSAEEAASCPGHNVEPLKNQLMYTGPDQLITKEGRMNFRCFQGQHYEDLYMVQHYLHGVGGGFFIELGALDGYSYSVTYFFEQFLKWDGLLIEASPKNFMAFKSKMRKLKPQRRRKAKFILAAACNEAKPITYVAKEGTGAGIFEFMPESEQKRVLKEGCPAMNMTDVFPMEENAVRDVKLPSCAMIPVKCVHLGTELVRRGVTHVDLFVLDVQGAELGVMQTLDFKQVPVRYFLIELDNTMPEKDAAVRCILRQNGFLPLGRLDLNELWYSPDFPLQKWNYTKPNQHWHRCFKGEIAKHLAPVASLPLLSGGQEPVVYTEAPDEPDSGERGVPESSRAARPTIPASSLPLPLADGMDSDRIDTFFVVVIGLLFVLTLFLFRSWSRRARRR